MATAKSVRVDIVGETTECIKKVEKLIEKHGGTVKGSPEGGDFLLKGVEGTFKLEDKAVVITVTRKPRLYPWFVIKKVIRDQAAKVMAN